MPPCSVRSMRSSCSPLIGAIDAAVHAASCVRTSSAERAAGVQMRITQAGEHLVHRVPGHADERPARDGVLELRRAIRKRAHQPAPRGRLTGVQLGDDVVDALLHPVVAGRRVHQCRGAEIVPEGVAVTTDPDPRLLRLPAAVHRRLRLQAGIGAEVVQHPVGLQGEQIGGIALLRIEERAVEEAHRRPAGTAPVPPCRRRAPGSRRRWRQASPASRAVSAGPWLWWIALQGRREPTCLA